MLSLLASPILVVAHAGPGPRDEDAEFTALREQFIRCFRRGDADGMAEILRSSLADVRNLFEDFELAWMEWEEAPEARHERARARAEALGAAVEEITTATGFSALAARMGEWTLDERSRWRGAFDEALFAFLDEEEVPAPEAIERLDRAHAMFLALEDHHQAWQVASRAGDFALDLEDADGALRRYDSALTSARRFGVPRILAEILLSRGDCQAVLGAESDAIASFEEAAVRAREDGNDLLEAEARSAAGNALFGRFELEAALPHLERAVELVESAGDEPQLARLLNDLANCRSESGDAEGAIATYERSLEIKERLQDPVEIALTRFNFGIALREAGRHREAVARFEPALAAIRATGDAELERDCLQSLGVSLAELGQFDRAIDAFQEALGISRALDDDPGTADVLEDLARIHAAWGRLDRAQELLAESEALGAGRRPGIERARLLSLLGGLNVAAGRVDDGRGLFERALERFEQAGWRPGVAGELDHLALCARLAGRLDESVDLAERSVGIYEVLGAQGELASALTNLASIRLANGEEEAARAHALRAIEIRGRLGTPWKLADSWQVLARAEAAAGRPAEAASRSAQALRELERVTMRSLPPAERAALRETFAQAPAEASAFARASGSREALRDAWFVVESTQGRTFAEETWERDLSGARDPEVAARLAPLVDRLESLRLGTEEAADGRSDPERRVATQAALRAAELELDETIRGLRLRDAALAQLAEPPRAGLDEVEAMLAPDAALLEFAIGRESSTLWVITRSGTRLIELPPAPQLTEPILRFTRAVRDPRAPLAEIAAAGRTLAALLGLGSPARDPALRHWHVVGGWMLDAIPFEALIVDEVGSDGELAAVDLPWLIRHRSISFAPSASALALQLRRPERADWPRAALVVADPVDERWSRLAHSRAEAFTVVGLLADGAGSTRSELESLPRSGSLARPAFELFLGDEANEGVFRRDLRPFRWLHLAAHGRADVEFPWSSGLHLSRVGESSGLLSALDVGFLQLDAEMVFLAGCETGSGPASAAEGTMSLARSFLVAGARSVIATRWPLRDDLAPPFARSVYARILDGHPPARALRMTQLAWISAPASESTLGALDVSTGGAEPRGASSLETDPVPASVRGHPHEWANFAIWGATR